MGQGRAIFLAACLFAGMAHAETVTVTAADCRKLVQHVPAKDVEYKPGVDVHGKKVVSADIDGGYNMPTLTPEDITIPISVDLANRLGRSRAHAQGNADPTTADRPLRAYESEIPVGTVTYGNGEVLWNGEPLAPKDEAILAAACRERLATATSPPAKPEVPSK
jgi:hypothetical protein